MRSLNHLLRRSVNDESIQRVYRWLFSRAQYLIRHQSKSLFGQFRSLIEQYHRDVPIEYLCGSAMFYHRLFIVNRHVLIPRRDSEVLIEEVRRLYPNDQTKRSILDVGTGSGCLAITLARLYPQWEIIACDLSSAALRVARQNAFLHRCRNIEFHRGNVFDEQFLARNSFDLIISNPPYISSKEISTCDRGILHEPHRALFANPPLKFYSAILERAAQTCLKPNGCLVFECSPFNVDGIEQLFRGDLTQLFNQIEIHRDTNDLPRVISAKKRAIYFP